MKPDVSIVVPAFNETDRLGESIEKILTYVDLTNLAAELIVVDDGSSDRTADVAREASVAFPNTPAHIIRYDQNRGKGFAVKTGLLKAAADIALFSDADLSTPIEELPKLTDPIASGEYDVIMGSRAIDRTLIGTRQPWRREQGGRVMNLIIRKMSGLDFSDTQCGFKAFNMLKFRSLLNLMTIDRFGFDVEFLFVAQYYGLKIAEIPVRWNDVAGSKVSVFRDTFRMFGELNQIRNNTKSGVYQLK
ncbi:MAG: dolichyl-phosphate beta-glucosyltransferase [Acidobacteriota bacterium]